VDCVGKLSAAEPLKQLGGGGVPQEHLLVAAGRQQFAIGTEGHRGRGDRRAVGMMQSSERGGLAPAGDVMMLAVSVCWRGAAAAARGGKRAHQPIANKIAAARRRQTLMS